MAKATVSACVMTFNNADVIKECMENIKWADEIIVVDSYSTDNTVEICREYTDKIHQRKWPGFKDQSNYIVSLANCVLGGYCDNFDNGCAADLNGDGLYNVLDIVSLANCVLANNCGG